MRVHSGVVFLGVLLVTCVRSLPAFLDRLPNLPVAGLEVPEVGIRRHVQPAAGGAQTGRFRKPTDAVILQVGQLRQDGTKINGARSFSHLESTSE